MQVQGNDGAQDLRHAERMTRRTLARQNIFAITIPMPDVPEAEFSYLHYIITSPFALIGFLFQAWMFIDALRRREFIWAVCIVAFSLVSALLYFFFVYRAQGGGAGSGFELPGAHSRRRIKELQAQIHHLDKAHHHLQLGDIYFQRAKYDLAEKHYRAALERDPADPDTRSHLGQCLLRKKQPAEAQPLLEAVVRETPSHDYGYTMMALAETYTALGHADAAVQIWERVLQQHSYARARVQLAELLLARQQTDAAREQIEEVIHSDAHAPAFDRKRNRVWLWRAKLLRRKLKAK